MKSLMLPVILQIAGILVIIAEIVIPSGGLLALIAIGLIGYSLYFVFTMLSQPVAMFFVLVDIIAIPAAVYLGLKLLVKSPATLKTTLSKENGVVSQSPELEKYIGMTGKSATDLRPSGAAIIDGKRLDVVTRGEYLEKSSEIIVLSVTGNQIIVGKKE